MTANKDVVKALMKVEQALQDSIDGADGITVGWTESAANRVIEIVEEHIEKAKGK